MIDGKPSVFVVDGLASNPAVFNEAGVNVASQFLSLSMRQSSSLTIADCKNIIHQAGLSIDFVLFMNYMSHPNP
jgi:hypothetical protein